MSNTTDGIAPSSPQPTAPKPGIWQNIKNVLARTETEFAFLKGLTFFGLFGSVIAAYFQYLISYHDKVEAQAKDDLAAATSAFTDASNALSIPLMLQERLVYSFYDAVNSGADKEKDSFVAQNARQISKDYEAAQAVFRQNVNLLARKMEISLDWSSNLDRDAAAYLVPPNDPINSSKLGEYGYDCDAQPPLFDAKTNDAKPDDTKAKEEIPYPHDPGKPKLEVDWLSAKHIIFVTYYCFHALHGSIELARQWASGNTSSLAADQANRKKILEKNERDAILLRLNNQVVRLNTFMSVAMFDIDKIRVKYRPRGVLCSLPIIREVIGARCKPIHEAEARPVAGGDAANRTAAP